MKIAEERLPDDIAMQSESDLTAVVVCRKCQQPVGRLQTVPVEEEADDEEVYAEIRLIAQEHRPMCVAQR